MRHTIKRYALLVVLVCSLCGGNLGWQTEAHAQLDGQAVVFLGEDPSVALDLQLAVDEEITVPLKVDLSGVTRTRGGTPTPAALGGYIISLSVNPEILGITVSGGEPPFGSAPTCDAKQDGDVLTVTCAASQASAQPTGK